MDFNRLTVATLCSVLTLMAPASYGNDIVDFLSALNGSSHGHGGHGAHHGHGQRAAGHHMARHRSRHVRRHIDQHHFTHSRRSVSINIGTHSPSAIYQPRVRPVVTPIYPPIPVVPTVPFYPLDLPHSPGEIVTCPVTVMPHVHVEDAHEIHPHAERIVIAVRDPHLPAWGSPGCVEQLVYVELFVPPCPPEEVEVSECRTKIELDFGKWEVEVTSANGVVIVEYDD